MGRVKRFSTNRERIFELTDAPLRSKEEEEEEDWVDLYDLLQIAPDTPTRDLDEIIIDRGADVVYFTFARSGRPPQIQKLEEHLREMRPILLDPPVRRRYDQQLRLHQEKNPQAQPYKEFLKTLDLRDRSEGCMAVLVVAGFPFLWLLFRAARLV